MPCLTHARPEAKELDDRDDLRVNTPEWEDLVKETYLAYGVFSEL